MYPDSERDPGTNVIARFIFDPFYKRYHSRQNGEVSQLYAELRLLGAAHPVVDWTFEKMLHSLPSTVSKTRGVISSTSAKAAFFASPRITILYFSHTNISESNGKYFVHPTTFCLMGS
jgi:hypothetical protein